MASTPVTEGREMAVGGQKEDKYCKGGFGIIMKFIIHIL
jgi:hypothetical protein